MKWPEEERAENGYLGNYWRAVDATIVRYRAALWRKAAVTSTRKLIEDCLKDAKGNGAVPRPPDRQQLCSWLDVQDLPAAAGAVLQDDSYNGISMGGALLAESAGAMFCTRPSVSRWQIVGQIIENDPLAQKVLVNLVEHRMLKRPGLRDDIRKIAGAIVRLFGQDLDGPANPYDGVRIAEMQRQWRAKPDLHEIWFGLRALGHVMPSRSDWHIFDLLFEMDIVFAAGLVEAYGDPYQIAWILQFGPRDPSRHFVFWNSLTEVTLSAFETDGAWNGRLLQPLLLFAAQDAMRSGPGYRGEGENVAELQDTRLAELAEATASILWERSDGGTTTLRWAGWLFRSMISALDGEGVPFPSDASSRARSSWLVLQALIRPLAAIEWLELRPPDLAPEDELCLEAVRILAAQQHERTVPGRDLLLEMLPAEPEDFLEGENAKRKLELPSLFVTFGKRVDAFGTRILAAALFDHDVAETFADIWRRTLVLREMAEHSHAFQFEDNKHDDRARRASETIRFVISLGINLIDYVQDVRQTVVFEDRRSTVLALFSTLYDATREMLAIDPIGQRHIENVHDHLCVRRFFYENARVGESVVAAQLNEADRPTAGELLYERCEVSRSFFESLQMFRANGVFRDQVFRALASVGVQFDHLIEQAERLNRIEHSRIIDLTGLKVSGA